MSLITCVSRCVYQEDGYCRLEQAASAGPSVEDGCVYCVPPAETNKTPTTPPARP